VPDDLELARALMKITEEARRDLKLGKLRHVSQEEVRTTVEKFARRGPPSGFYEPDLAGSCDVCHGGGFKPVLENRLFEVPGPGGQPVKVERQVRAVLPCECRSSRPIEPATVSDLPFEFRDARLVNYTQRLENAHAVVSARDFDSGARRHLYLHGPTGRGKSRLAASLLNEAAARGVSAAFVRVPWLMLLRQLGIDDAFKQAEANTLLDRALRTPIVALDDIAGGEKGSDFTRGLMVTILDRRFDHDLPTLITSNLRLQELSEFYCDTRIPSRIAGACGQTIELGGVDARIAQRPVGRGTLRSV
jgi:DNA replication protein DnaC